MILEKLFFRHKAIVIAVHIAIGFLATFSFFPKMYAIIAIVIGAFIIFNTRNRDEEAFYLSGYIVGLEVFSRMTKGFFFYETGKYTVILFLLIGIFFGPIKQKFSVSYVFYLLLLLFGVVLTQIPEGESIRNAIVFNLSGPIVLGISALYFFKRVVSKRQLLNALFAMVLPLFSMVAYLYFRTPDIKEILFGGVANFETSGGFGPNQVATVLGLGIFVIVIFIITKEKLTGYLWLDSIFLIYFIYRGLLTFSRGGIIASAIAILLFFIFYILYQKGSFKLAVRYLFIGGFFVTGIWLFTSNATGGMLDNRYTNKNAAGIQKKDISAGRIAIFETQIAHFVDNPVGIGVGNGKYKRELEGDSIAAASHNEIGRMIEEHGLLGLFLLLMLLIVPLRNMWYSNNYQRAFLVAFYLLWFLTINHSAMRIAFPGFIYGLSLLTLVNDKK